jgi:hypothetical protein
MKNEIILLQHLRHFQESHHAFHHHGRLDLSHQLVVDRQLDIPMAFDNIGMIVRVAKVWM